MDADFWPPADAFVDLSAANTLADRSVRCTGVALCDVDGRATTSFEQGQPAHFFYEFEILEAIEGAAGGLEFHDATNRTVHGKNLFQFDRALPHVAAGTRLRHHHVVHLEVAPGEYRFTVGLASASPRDYEAYRDGRFHHEQFGPRMREHCRVIDAGSFSVQYGPTGKLLHHGVANLPGWCDVSLSTPVARAEPADRASSPSSNGSPRTASQPTLIHVTHWKAGSQWIRRILEECAPDRIVSPKIDDVQFMNWPVRGGGVYPTVYVTKQQFDRVRLPESSRYFVVIRDLRDTLVSAYFSFKVSHQIEESGLAQVRETLQSVSAEEGLLHLIREFLPRCANIQTTWLESGERLIRYEDLLDHDVEILEPLLLDHCRLPIGSDVLRETVRRNRFESLTKNRARGQEDASVHERKGIAGDWRNHFTEPVKKAFKLRYGPLLLATGYERSSDW